MGGAGGTAGSSGEAAKAAKRAKKALKALGEPCSASEPEPMDPCSLAGGTGKGTDSTGLGESYLKEKAKKAQGALEHENKMNAESTQKESVIKGSNARAKAEREKKLKAH